MRRRRRRSGVLDPDPGADARTLLEPLIAEIASLAATHHFEDAASRRDEAERIRALLARNRRVASLRAAGRVLLHVEGEGTIEIQDGLLADAGTLFAAARDARPDGAAALVGADVGGIVADGHDNERVLIAQWLGAHPERVRILEVDGPEGLGLAMPADRIPELGELVSVLWAPSSTAQVHSSEDGLATPEPSGTGAVEASRDADAVVGTTGPDGAAEVGIRPRSSMA